MVLPLVRRNKNTGFVSARLPVCQSTRFSSALRAAQGPEDVILVVST